jgi:hypothetical protein
MLEIPIKLGGDPEFELGIKKPNGGYEIVTAGNFSSLSNVYKDYNGRIGRDGSKNQLEIRPTPSSKPDMVVRHIKNLLNKTLTLSNMSDKTIIVSGNKYPLGGHIHVGLKKSLGKEAIKGYIQMLDDFIGAPTLNLCGSARGPYKKLGEMRTKSYGFEYRTPPSTVFYSPDTALTTYRLVKNLGDLYFNSRREVKYNTPISIDDLVDIGGLSSHEINVFKNDLMEFNRLLSLGLTIPISTKWFGDAYADGNPVQEKPVNPEPAIRSSNAIYVYFLDEWESDIRNEMERILELAFINVNFPVSRIGSWSLSLFGFKQTRGLITNISVPIETGLEVDLSFPILADGHPNSIRVGLPYRFRKDSSFFNDIKIPILEAIIETVREEIEQNSLCNGIVEAG